MASDYATIRADNKSQYGTAIGRIGPMLPAERYDDRTHFIFKLLQTFTFDHGWIAVAEAVEADPAEQRMPPREGTT